MKYKRELDAEDSSIAARLLENEAGLVVGWASVEDDPLWGGTAALLDLFVHPAAWQGVSDLLTALPLPPKPIFAYADEDSPKNDLLQRARILTPGNRRGRNGFLLAANETRRKLLAAAVMPCKLRCPAQA